jgi:DNA-binding transcriptional MerR regulator
MKPLRYPIRAASRLTGIPVETLRAWERRYGVVEPSRDDRGRLYSEADVERLALLRRAVEAGHAIGRVAALPTRELRALLAAPATRNGGPPDRAVDLSALWDAVERFDAPAFRRELSRLAALLPVHVLCRDVALPFLNLVGEAWHGGRIDVAREHLASAEIRNVLGTLARLQPSREGAPAVVLATPTTELHEIGTLAAAIVAADAGLSAVYLGPNLPAADVLSAAARASAKDVVLGWTGSREGPGPGEETGVAARAVVEIARALPAGVALWVGGKGAREAERITRGRATALETFEEFEKAVARMRAR